MIIKHKHTIGSIVLSILLLLTACSVEVERINNGLPQADGHMLITGEIAGSSTVKTRAQTEDKLPISYQSFEYGDEIGFYTFHDIDCPKGDMNGHKGLYDTDYLKNKKFIYSDVGFKAFRSEDKIDAKDWTKFGSTFAYFPYSDKERPQTHAQPAAEEDYIHIFMDEKEEGGPHIVDLLTASKRRVDGSDLNYTFKHTFAMVLFELGEGFNPSTTDQEGNPLNEKLTIHLTEKILGAHITRNWADLVGNHGAFYFEIDRVPKSEANKYEGVITLTAPKIDGYKLPDAEMAKTYYPLILPEGTKIDYIEVYDKTGMLQRVKPDDGLPSLKASTKQTLTIAMTGLTAVVYPHEILPWGEPEQIKIENKPKGIYNEDDFKKWLDVYNRYAPKLDNVEENDLKILLEYGEYSEGTEPGASPQGWTFYLRNNINCKDITTKTGSLINELGKGVTLDGGYFKLDSLMLDFEYQAPTSGGGIGLINKITGGQLQNLRMEYVTVRNLTVDGKNIPSGCIAATISGGNIINCYVRQAGMVCDGVTKAGVLAGEITAATEQIGIDNCRFQGIVQIDASLQTNDLYKGVIGKGGNNNTIIKNLINDLTITTVRSNQRNN